LSRSSGPRRSPRPRRCRSTRQECVMG
jgi:hypothetical protein